jgi:hypothetical protein
LEQVPDSYMGIDVANLINYLKEHRREAAPLIRLA